MNASSTVTAIVNGLSTLADKLSVPAGQLMAWAIQNNYATAWIHLVGAVGCSVAIYVYYRFVKFLSIVRKDRYGDEVSRLSQQDNEGWIIVTVLGGIVAVVLFFVFFNDLEVFISRMVAPQYNAVQDIVNAINGK